MGHLCEDLGSRIETVFEDDRGKRQPEHKVEWHRYLPRAYKIEPIGHRYMRTLVLRLKFELNSLPALLSVAFGVWFTHTSESAKCLATSVALSLVAYLSYEAYTTHNLLGELRHELLSSPIELVPEAQKEDSLN